MEITKKTDKKEINVSTEKLYKQIYTKYEKEYRKQKRIHNFETCRKC